MDIQENQIIGELVAEDYRTASVFSKYGIDFCCQGNRTINDACISESVDPALMLADLNKVTLSNIESNIQGFESWPLDLLAGYIENKHHSYVRRKSEEILPLLDKICSVHGEQHPELFEIKAEFNASVRELSDHMKKEEKILFPYIISMVLTKKEGLNLTTPAFESVKNPLQMLKEEHLVEGERFRKIRELSNDYLLPKDSCNTYRITFELLKEFEQDLHLHIHLENNILFPKAIELENELL